jgi:hypothetical protein
MERTGERLTSPVFVGVSWMSVACLLRVLIAMIYIFGRHFCGLLLLKRDMFFVSEWRKSMLLNIQKL